MLVRALLRVHNAVLVAVMDVLLAVVCHETIVGALQLFEIYALISVLLAVSCFEVSSDHFAARSMDLDLVVRHLWIHLVEDAYLG